MRYTTAEKLAFAKMHVDENVPIHEIGRKYEFAVSTLKYCCNLYRRYGEAGFRRGEKARTYTREEKLKAIAEIIGGGRSSRAVALDLMLSDPKIVLDWVAKYRQEGEAGIKDTYSRAAYMRHDERILEKEHKKLLEDLRRTKAENEYLKKSFPHMLGGSKPSRKK